MKKIEALNCYITVNNDTEYGIVDKDEKVLVKNEYMYIDYTFDKYFVAYKENEGLGIIDKDGNVLIDFGYDVLSKIGDKKLLKGVDMGREKEITTIYSKDMKEIAKMESAIISIASDHIELYNDKEIILITNEGEIKTPKELFKDQKLYAVQKNNKWGFEDENGEIKVKCEYDYITDFNRYGFAGIKKDNKWGVVSSDGDIICECKFEFGENSKPELLGKYYKTFKENNEIYYTDVIDEDAYFEGGL